MMKLLLVIMGILGSVTSSSAQNPERTLIAASGTSHVELLELYTSESCSSCPPADKWLSQLKSNPELWKNFVPVAFHVDYWNNLGWKDGLSSEAMTQRQTDLSKLWQEPSVYTPASVLDGKEWRDWRNSQNPKASLSNPQKIALSIFREGDGSFTVKVDGPTQNFVVKIALLGLGISTNVTGGENSGKVLAHDFSVLAWEGKKMLAPQKEENFKLNTSPQKGSRTAIAAWIERDGNPTPLQAVGGYL